MKLTSEQSQWLETVTANGMTVAKAAVDWAQRSKWSQRCETLDSVTECLESDLRDGNANRVSAKQDCRTPRPTVTSIYSFYSL